MNRRRTRATTLGVAALLTTGLAVPLTASPALASTPVETQFFTNDADGDFNYGLYKRATPSGSATPVIAESATVDVDALAASQDGSRFVARVRTYDSSGVPLRQRLEVFDVSGQLVRVVVDVADSATHVVTPALSPDGSTLVWSAINESTHAYTLMKAPVTSGAATTVASNLGNAVFADATTLVAEDLAGPWYSITTAGGSKTVIPSISDQASEPTVSSDGGHLAWTLDTSSTDPASDIQAASLAVVSGVATVGTPVQVATGLYNFSPAFSRDGANVLFVRADYTLNGDGMGHVYSAPADGSGTAGTQVPDATPPADVDGQAIGTTDDGTAPGTPTTGTASAGTSPTLRWTLPSDTDLSYVLVKRYSGTSSATGSLQRYFQVNAPLASFKDSGLDVGGAYTYTFTAYDRSGNHGTASADKTLVAIQPTGTFSDPTSATTTTAPFPVKFGLGVPTGTPFWVYYRVNSGSSWATWVNGVAGTTRTFGIAGTTGVNATTASRGGTYQFKIQARDSYGNYTSQVLSGRATVPFDQTSATFSTGTTYSNSSSWYGSFRVIKTAGSYAKISIVGDRFQIIGAKCAGCGVFDLYDNGVKVAAIDTYRSSTLYRTVLYTRTWSTIGSHTLVIKARGTAGRPQVILDGFGMRH